MRDQTHAIHSSWLETINGHPHFMGKTYVEDSWGAALDTHRWAESHPEAWLPAGAWGAEVQPLEHRAEDDEPTDPETVAGQLEQMRQMLMGAEAKRKAKWGR